MGNCFAVGGKNRNTVQVVKMDGNIIEFSVPILVQDVLLNFPGYHIYLAKKSPRNLPPSFQLSLGHKYYLIPPVQSSKTADEAGTQVAEKEQSSGAVKRIKVVITRQQLQELLSKQVLAKDLVSGLESKTSSYGNNISFWKPNLESIPEENELISSVM